jgi:hypothetical protein
MAIEIADYSRF